MRCLWQPIIRRRQHRRADCVLSQIGPLVRSGAEAVIILSANDGAEMKGNKMIPILGNVGEGQA